MNSDRHKYRAWDTDDLVMRDWDNLLSHRYGRKGDSIFSDTDLIIMQSTGLKDKNGVLCFEGDILQWSCETLPIVVDTFHAPTFMFGEELLCKGHVEGGKILGNIHENPELLEKKS